MKENDNKIGAQYFGNGKCNFTVWAPLLKQLFLHVISGENKTIPLLRDNEGYFNVLSENITPGDNYFYRLNERFELPDPASYYQPEGIYGPSCVVDHSSFKWRDQLWEGISPEKIIIYELHIGTFTEDGTFEAA